MAITTSRNTARYIVTERSALIDGSYTKLVASAAQVRGSVNSGYSTASCRQGTGRRVMAVIVANVRTDAERIDSKAWWGSFYISLLAGGRCANDHEKMKMTLNM
jgi:hypothetical protein